MPGSYDYTIEDDCLKLVGDITDISTDIKQLLTVQLLNDSAGKSTGDPDTLSVVTTYFRPYYVAARQLQRNRDDQFLESSDGAKFTNLTRMIQSLLEEQLALDAKLALDIPEGYSAKEALRLMCGCASSDAWVNHTVEIPVMSAFVV